MKSRWSTPLCQESIPSSRHRKSNTSYALKSPPSWSHKVSMMIYQWSSRVLKLPMRQYPCQEYKNQSAQKYLLLWTNGALWSKICKVQLTSTSEESLCQLKIKCHNLPRSSSKKAQDPMQTSSCTCKPHDSHKRHPLRCLVRRSRRKRRICSISTHRYFLSNSQRNLVQCKFRQSHSSDLRTLSEHSG